MTASRLMRNVDTVMIAACMAIGAMWAPATAVATEDSAASTPAPGGTPTAAACPSTEYPAAGALGMTDGTIAWLACSPVEAHKIVIGASNGIVLITESGPGGQDVHTIALGAADGTER